MNLLFGEPPVTMKHAPLVVLPITGIVKLIKSDPDLMKITKQIRGAKDKAEQRKLKSKSLPYVLPFNYSELVRNSKNFESAEMLMFEADDVANVPALVKRLQKLPYVSLCYTSVSGKGVKFLVKLGTTLTADTYVKVYNIVMKQLGDVLEVQLDIANKDMARVQYICHDPEVYFNPKATVFQVKEILSRLDSLTSTTKQQTQLPIKWTDKDVRKAIAYAHAHGYHDNKSEQRWWELSMSLASLQEAGREYFLLLSSNHPLYPDDTDEKLNKRYDSFMKAWGQYSDQERVLNMDSFFHIIEKDYGYKGMRISADGKNHLERILADKFAARYKDELLFDHAKGAGKNRSYGWYMWDTRRFAMSKKGEISDYYLRFVDEEKKKALEALEKEESVNEGITFDDVLGIDIICKAESRRMRDLTLLWAGEREGLGVIASELDENPDLFCINNGVLNLSDGKLLKHDPMFRMTKLSAAVYQKTAKCPNWENFILKICHGNTDIVKYIQEAVGYSMTGYTSEQCLFFLYGIGANGKSTFLEGLKLLFGDYQINANYETFTSISRDGNSASEDVVRLKGARLVVSTEINSNKPLNESIIKSITGGDLITARDLHSSSIEFKPNLKLWICGNHKPKLENFDHGIKRRIFIIPFEYQFTAADIRPQQEVLREFEQELPGILNWALTGARRWYKNKRLNVPEAVTATTQEFFMENNIVEQFIRDNCILGEEEVVDRRTICQSFRNYSQALGGEKEITRTELYKKIEELGFRVKRSSQGVEQYVGLSLGKVKTKSAQVTVPK